MSQFVNPYNFVPVKDTVERIPYTELQKHHRLYKESYSGRLICKITTLTRLFIPSRIKDDIDSEPYMDRYGRQEHPIFKKFLRNHLDQPIIPGTSIRGMIRSVAEAISNSCLTLFDGEYEIKKGRQKIKVNHSNKVADTLKHQNCKIADEHGKPIVAYDQGICMCCRIFGMANEQEKTETQETQNEDQILRNVFASKVIFSDAILQTEDKIEQKTITLKELSSPKPNHEPFYIENNKIKGRKFYYHQNDSLSNYNDPNNSITQRNQTIEESIISGAEFEFEVTFTNLTKQELGLLLWTLELDDKNIDDSTLMAHRIGMGKPIGLGSAKIQVIRMEIINPEKRYTSFGESNEVFENEKLRKKIIELRKAYNPDPFASLPELKNILTFNFASGNVRYPDYNRWFQQDSRLPVKTKLPADGKLNDPPGASTTRASSSRRQTGTRRTQSQPTSNTRITRVSISDRTESETEKQHTLFEGTKIAQIKRISNKGVFVEIDGQEIAITGSTYGLKDNDTIKIRVDRDKKGKATVYFKGKK